MFAPSGRPGDRALLVHLPVGPGPGRGGGHGGADHDLDHDSCDLFVTVVGVWWQVVWSGAADFFDVSNYTF